MSDRSGKRTCKLNRNLETFFSRKRPQTAKVECIETLVLKNIAFLRLVLKTSFTSEKILSKNKTSESYVIFKCEQKRFSMTLR